MAMAENDRGDTASSKEGESWGTLEELLLACAVSRHGTNSWDSIAMEVQKRTTSSNGNSQISNNFLNAFTPHNCRQRYHALNRRFNVASGDERPDGDGDAVKANEENEVGGERELREKLPFIVDELRKLRVEELRRDLERHDVSIVSLQLKVKRLEEDRETTSLKAETASGEADLRMRADRSDAGDERSRREPDRSSAEVADKSMTSERSDEPEDRSFNESNSTNQKGAPPQGKESNRRREQGENRKNEPDPVRPVAESEPDKDSSSSRRGLEEEKAVGRTSQPVPLGHSGELRESVSESKREVKQSSDVQSSASLSRKKRRGWRRSEGVGVGSSGDEMEAEELSPANRRMDVRSQPLIKFMGILRSHEHALVFQRRLPSQETEEYRNLIRQHMDLETVQSKLEQGMYCDCHSKLYRDILLIFANATLFFHKTSPEHVAAHELRKLATKEIVAQQPPQKPKPSQQVKPPTTELESQIHDPVVKKPRSSTNIVVCRRRTNPNAIKPSSLSTEPNMTTKSKEDEVENKDKSKKLKEGSSLIGRSLAAKTATSNNNSGGGSGNKKSKGMGQGESNNSNNASASNYNSNSDKKGKKDESSDEEEEQPINKRRRLLQPSLKKQGVVNFLKRMKQNSPSKEAVAGANDVEEEQEQEQEERATKKNDTSKKKLVAGKKKEGGDSGGGKDEGAAKRVSGRRSTRGGEETGRSENVRRGGGRPPTRKAAMGGGGVGTPDTGRLKRQKDGDKEVATSGRGTSTAKKKSRR